MADEDDAPKRPSSWAAALSQLPGFPQEGKPKLPKAPAIESRASEEEPACNTAPIESSPRTSAA